MQKTTTAKTKKVMKADKKSGKKEGILTRFDDVEDAQLRLLGEAGVNMSEVVRECVKRSLPSVVADLRAKLAK